MPLDPLQQKIVAILKSRRSTQSFIGGSSVFNVTFPRRSDDIDYAEDVPIDEIADRDVDALRDAGLHVVVDRQFYGFAIEAIVTETSTDRGGTKLDWTEADRQRFYPIQADGTFGWTLHKTDLAVQKLLAAATRRKARDALDILLIDLNYAPLTGLAIAAPAKLEGMSPVAILERALLNGMQHPLDDYLALRIDDDAMPFPIGSIKSVLTDKIGETIDRLTNECAAAEPGFIYLRDGEETPREPTEAALLSMTKHAISVRGTVPIFSFPGSASSRSGPA